MSQTDEFRIERKIPIDAAGLAAFRDWHVLNGSRFRESYAPRRVNSIYFDAPDLADFAANLDGNSERTKMRLRWYGDTTAPQRLRLEFKRKRAGASSKHAVEILDPPPLDRGLRRFVRSLRSHVPSDLRLDLDAAPMPVLWNCYAREYYATRQDLRVTVDTDLMAADVVRDRLESRRLRRSPIHAVLELKFPIDREDEMRELLGSLPLRVAKHSKYATGVSGAPW